MTTIEFLESNEYIGPSMRRVIATKLESLQAEVDILRVALSGASGINMDEELKARNEELQSKLDKVRGYCELVRKPPCSELPEIMTSKILELLK